MGRLVATPNALSQIAQDDITSALRRHLFGDWGELDSEDRDANGTKFWIITEADRASTTLLMP